MANPTGKNQYTTGSKVSSKAVAKRQKQASETRKSPLAPGPGQAGTSGIVLKPPAAGRVRKGR